MLDFANDGIEHQGGWPKVPEHDGSAKIFLDVEGDLIGPGSYGHMGVGTFILRVTRVIEVRAPSAEACGR